MGTENNVLNPSIRRAIESGESAVRLLNSYIASHKKQVVQVERLYSNLSVVVELLKTLEAMTDRSKNDVSINSAMIEPIALTCLGLFDTIKAALFEMSVLPAMSKLDSWCLFNMVLGGGRAAADDYWRTVVDTRYSLVLLLDAFKYAVLKHLNERHRVELIDTAELNYLTANLPQLVQGLQQPWTKHLVMLDNIDKIVEVAATDNREGNMDRYIDWKASSQITMTEIHDLDFENYQVPKDRDWRSSDYSDSMASNNFVDTSEFYEEWVLNWNEPTKGDKKVWRLLGMNWLQNYYEKEGFWAIDPELSSQEELKARYKIAICGVPREAYIASMEKIIRTLPEDARTMIQYLIEDREIATSNESFKREWYVIGLHEKPRNTRGPRIRTTSKPDWIVMIKGETIDRLKRIEPSRYSDPWRNQLPPGRASSGHHKNLRRRTGQPAQVGTLSAAEAKAVMDEVSARFICEESHGDNLKM